MEMPLSVHDFAAHIATGLGFGVSSEESAAALRKLADAIEAKEIFVQGARVFGVATSEDFTITTLRLSFAETNEKPLRGPYSRSPVEVAKP
jgi:hypothetical protein